MLQHFWIMALLYLTFLFFVHHGRKIASVLYIYPSTGTENNTECALWSLHDELTLYVLLCAVVITQGRSGLSLISRQYQMTAIHQHVITNSLTI